MKKWMRAMSLMFALLMMFCLMGSVGVEASSSSDEVIRGISSVKYMGDPVPYDGVINPSDFRVYVTTNYGRRQLDAGEYTISPDTMESRRNQRVYVYVTGTNYRSSVTVEYAEPRLESIEVRYRGEDLIVNGEVDRDDVVVEAFYDDGTSKDVDDWDFDGSNRARREGSNTISVVYREDDERAYDEFTVYAYEGELDYITAYYNGGNVIVGNKVDTSKIKVSGVYASRGYGSTTQTLTGWSLSDNRAVQEGNNTFTVVYNEDGKQYTDTITVKGVVSSTANTNPNTNTNTNNVISTSSRSGAWVPSGALWKFQLSNKTYLKNSWVQSAETAKWYFVNADGYMVANRWAQINGKWYFLSEDGTMVTGWKMIDGKWYYLNAPNGDMHTGWKQINGQYYYLDPVSGEMAVSRWIDNYYVNENGVWTQTR